MAETADILANRPEKLAERGGERVTVVLPDMAAGCSMADMAAIEQVEAAWEEMGEVIDTSRCYAGHLHQFSRESQGVLRAAWRHRLHIEQRGSGARWSFERRKPRAFLPRSTFGPQHGQGDGRSAQCRCPSGIRTRRS